MRLGIIGYGAIAAVHASVLRAMPGVDVSVWGPDRARAKAFAREHGVMAVARLHDHLGKLDGVVVASPTSLHERQAAVAIRAGVAALVELPACRSAVVGRRLARLAVQRGVRLEAAHTALYLDPYRMVRDAVAQGQIGQIRRVSYRREVPKRARNWADDPLRHHTQHAIDLLIEWFGAVTPRGCYLTPRTGAIDGVRASLTVPGGADASIEVRYRAGAPFSTLRIEGATGWLETDGFTTVTRSHGPELRWDGDKTYREAIRRQDDAFAAALSSNDAGADGWTRMLEATVVIDRLAAIAARRDG